MGWEDTWIPLVRRGVDGQFPSVQFEHDILTKPTLPQETENHRALRLAYAYQTATLEVRPLLEHFWESQHRAWMGSEFCSPTYSPFWCQAVGAMALTAAEREDREILRHCVWWFEALRAVYAWLSVPGRPWWVGRLRRGDVVGVGGRFNRQQNRDQGIMLRMLCGETNRRDRRVIARAGKEFNLYQLEYARRLLDRGVLGTRPLDPEGLRGYLPKVASPIWIGRWEDGYRARCWGGWRSVGPAQLGVTVHRGRVEFVSRTEKSGRAKEWREDRLPPALGQVTHKVVLKPTPKPTIPRRIGSGEV